MWNRYQPYRRRGIRFFPHIFPIAFPIIFPFGFWIALGLLHAVFFILGPLLLVALILIVIRALTQGNPGARWNVPNQWQQPFTSQQQQPPYYQPPQQQAPYYQPQQPYYQPPTPTEEEAAQPYGQGYQPQQPYYHPSGQSNDVDQPPTQYPEQMPPMQQ